MPTSRPDYFAFSHEERLMPVSDNERMAIQHRLAKKKRAQLIVHKLEEMEKMSRATDKKLQKRYQRMLGNLITTTTDRYLYDCFCRFEGILFANPIITKINCGQH